MQKIKIPETKVETEAEKTARLKREIHNRKRRWNRAGDDKRRVLVAKDVLDQIASYKFQPLTSAFLIVDNQNILMMSDNESIQGCLLDNKTDCKGCAIGGAMMSMIRFNNNALVGDLDYCDVRSMHLEYTKVVDMTQETVGRTISSQLHELFGESQLMLIEQAFEWCKGTYSNPRIADYNQMTFEEIIALKVRRTGKSWKAYLFGRQYEVPRDRLIAIMQNIVDNKGTFIP